MQLRLAFAVAAHLEPEILIVDEVLAVGDASFQRKCLGKMDEVSGHGRTVLIVSHNMSAVTTLATHCLWLDAGRVRELGDPAHVVASYLGSDANAGKPGFANLSDPELRHGDPKRTHGDVRFQWVRVRDDVGDASSVVFTGEALHLDLGLRSAIAAKRLEVLCIISTLDGVLVFTLMTGELRVDLEPLDYELTVTVPFNQLRSGRYAVDLYVLTGVPQDYVRSAIQFEVAGPREASSDARDVQPWGVVDVEHSWTDLRPRLRHEQAAAIPAP
jgi:lipopolysaccharide transport system ATP-binding protein